MTATVDDAPDRLRQQDAAMPADGTLLTIAEVAQRSGVSAHTLRYYERVGLLSVGRDAAGHRSYTSADFARVVFLYRLRMTGMPIRELQRYIGLVGDGEHTVSDRLQMLLSHRDAVCAQLADLTAALEAVEFKIAAYGGACAP